MRTLATLLALGALLAVAAVAMEQAEPWPPADGRVHVNGDGCYHSREPGGQPEKLCLEPATPEAQGRTMPPLPLWSAVSIVTDPSGREWDVPLHCRVLPGLGGDVECAPPDGAMDPPTPDPTPATLAYPPGLSDVDRALYWLRCVTLHPDQRESCGPAPMPR